MSLVASILFASFGFMALAAFVLVAGYFAVLAVSGIIAFITGEWPL